MRSRYATAQTVVDETICLCPVVWRLHRDAMDPRHGQPAIFLRSANISDTTGRGAAKAEQYADLLAEYRRTFQAISMVDRRAMQAIVFRLWRGWHWQRVAQEMKISPRRAPEALDRGRAMFEALFPEEAAAKVWRLALTRSGAAPMAARRCGEGTSCPRRERRVN